MKQLNVLGQKAEQILVELTLCSIVDLQDWFITKSIVTKSVQLLGEFKEYHLIDLNRYQLVMTNKVAEFNRTKSDKNRIVIQREIANQIIETLESVKANNKYT